MYVIFKPNNQVKVKGTEERSRYDGMHCLNAIDANCEVKYEVKFFVGEQENINVFTLMRSTKSRLTTCVDKNSNDMKMFSLIPSLMLVILVI